jgi:ADP-ribosylglycohydrolase
MSEQAVSPRPETPAARNVRATTFGGADAEEASAVVPRVVSSSLDPHPASKATEAATTDSHRHIALASNQPREPSCGNGPTLERVVRNTSLAVVAFALALALPGAAADDQSLSRAEVRDKIAGGWYGAVIAGAWGEPTEFRFNGRVVPADRVPRWNVAGANRYAFQGESDETYVEIPFLDATLHAAPGAGYPEWGQALAASRFELFFANRRARENLRAGIPAPASGNPANNPRAYDIDFQIESDWIGLALPDQPGAAAELAWRVGHVTSYGDGVYGGVMIAALHAAAFRAASVREIVEAGREAIPEGTAYRQMIEDVLRLHRRHPRDWQAAWGRLERSWNAHSRAAKRTAVNAEFNIDAKLNGAYVLLGLLYGGGDFERTIRIAMRAGQDSDCNPSNAASILGTWIGRSGIPHRFRHGIARDRPFPHTDYTLKSSIAANLELAATLSAARGGQTDERGWSVTPSPVEPAPFEQWAP